MQDPLLRSSASMYSGSGTSSTVTRPNPLNPWEWDDQSYAESPSLTEVGRISDNYNRQVHPREVGTIRQRIIDRVGHIESLDYDDFESKCAQVHTLKHEKSAKYLYVSRWIFTILIGICTGFMGYLIDTTGQPLLYKKLNITSELIMMEITGDAFPGSAYLHYLAFCTFCCIVAASIVSFIEPMSSGAGVPEIKTLLNGVKIHRAVRIKTLICKTLALPFALASSLPVGKVGPLIHIGGIIGAGISQGKSSTLGLDTTFSKFAEFRNDKEKRDFIACGTAAGVAAAFGAPIGGMLFTLEAGASFFDQDLVWRLFVCALVASYFFNLLSTITNASSYEFDGSLISFGSFDNTGFDSYTLGEMVIFLIMGGIGGIIGGIMNELNKRINIWRTRSNIVKGKAVFEAVFATILYSSLSFLFSFYIGTCHPMPDISQNPYRNNLVQFYCNEDEFNDLASLLITSPANSIRQMFHTIDDQFSLQTLCAFFALYTSFVIWVYGMNIPGGNFVPNVIAGSLYGRLINIGLCAIPQTIFILSSRNVYALMGAASFLGGIGRNPVSLTVILLECTGNVKFGLPLMVTLVGAKWIGGLMGPSLYDIHIILRHLPFLPWNPHIDPITSKLKVKNIMRHRPICLRKRERVGVIYDLLTQCTHNGFPVIDQHPLDANNSRFFSGYILRHHLTSLLKMKVFTAREPILGGNISPSAMGPNMKHALDITFNDIEASYPRYPNIKTINITFQERSLWLDLTPFMNAHPYTVNENMSIQRTYKLFRRLGLRHLIVVDDVNDVTGIITRKDLNVDHLKSKGIELHTLTERLKLSRSHLMPDLEEPTPRESEYQESSSSGEEDGEGDDSVKDIFN